VALEAIKTCNAANSNPRKLSRKQQIRASAWASYLTGIGSIVSYFCGFVDLPRIFCADSLTQFQSLSLVAPFMIIITVTVSCLWVTEKVSART